MKVQKLTEKEMDRELCENEGTVVIDFYADWCGPCKMLAPIYEELAEEMPGIFFGKVNVEEEEEAARRFGVRSVPTVLIFRDGKEVAKSRGFVRKAALRESVASAARS